MAPDQGPNGIRSDLDGNLIRATERGVLSEYTYGIENRLVGVLEALVVENEPLDDELAETLRGPDAEPGGDSAFDAVADGDDGVEVVKLDAAWTERPPS